MLCEAASVLHDALYKKNVLISCVAEELLEAPLGLPLGYIEELGHAGT